MLAKIYFKLDNFKEVSIRSSVEILDFLGDIGGFMGALKNSCKNKKDCVIQYNNKIPTSLSLSLLFFCLFVSQINK